MKSETKTLLYALATFGAGMVLSWFSYHIVSLVADPYMESYVYNRPIEQAVYSLDRYLGYMDIADTVLVAVSLLLLVASMYFAIRYVKAVGEARGRRIGVIVIATLAGCQAAGTLVALFLV